MFQCESHICGFCFSAFEVKALPTDDPKVAAAFQAIEDGWSDEWTSKKLSVHSMCDKIIYCMLVTSCYFTVYLMISYLQHILYI